MPKLNLNTAVRQLRESEEMRAVDVAKVKKPDSSPGEVKVKMSPALKFTKITQTSSPRLSKPKEDSKSGLQIPTAEFGGDIVDKAPKMTFKNVKRGTQGAVKAPSAKTVSGVTKPRPDLKKVGGDYDKLVRRTEEGGGFGQSVEFLSGSASANEIEAKLPKGLKSGSNATPTVGKVKPETIGPESPAAGKVSIKQPVDQKKIPQIKKPSGMQPDPSDGGDRPKSFDKVEKTDNVRESVRSGVTVKLGNKVKAQFGLASVPMLSRMVESYRQHGYTLTVEATGNAGWKKDRKLLRTVWESVDAEFNFVPGAQQRLRRAGLNRLSQISQGDYTSLYESRQEFVNTLVSGFEAIEKAVRKRYVESMELMTCNVRFVSGTQPIDAEIVTEAHSKQMALRQIRNLLQETYGLDTKLVHVFVDGTKFTPDQIEPWKSVTESQDDDDEELDETEGDQSEEEVEECNGAPMKK